MSVFSGNQDTPMDLSVKTRRKLRLEEFLRQNLDHAPADRVIQWVDREQGIFRILWTHQSSGAFTQEDAALFRYWALARGKPANLSSVELKQSLRMALNKSPSVERVNAAHDEYRYFRFSEWSGRQSDQRTSSSHLDSDPYVHEHSAYSNSSSRSYYSSIKEESDLALHDQYSGYKYAEDPYSRDYRYISESPSSLSSISSTSSSSGGSCSFHPYPPSEFFQIPEDLYGAHGTHSSDRNRRKYLDASKDRIQFSRAPPMMDALYRVPSEDFIPKVEHENYSSLFMDRLPISYRDDHPSMVHAALYEKLHEQFSSSMTIDRRKHNVLP